MEKYTVLTGDSLSKIALKYFGSFDQIYIDMLATANGITNTATIFPGQVLDIPNVLPEVEIVDKDNTKWWILGGIGLLTALYLYNQRQKKNKDKATA